MGLYFTARPQGSLVGAARWAVLTGSVTALAVFLALALKAPDPSQYVGWLLGSVGLLAVPGFDLLARRLARRSAPPSSANEPVPQSSPPPAPSGEQDAGQL